MAIFGIRTALGPQATADRRRFELAKIEAEEKLKLEQEATKQLTKGDPAMAAAMFGTNAPPPPPVAESMIDWTDPTTQVVVAGLAAAAFIAYRRMS